MSEPSTMSRSVESIELQEIVRRRIDRWYAGGRPDAAGVLAEHPELAYAKSLVMDLALAEFNLRMASGDVVERSEFCEQFPGYRQSIERLLTAQNCLDQFPEFAVGADELRSDKLRDKLRWPAVGDAFLGYEIVEPLGRGGLARVFLARETAVGQRYVVIKVSPYGTREAQTLGKLSHASIVPIFSVQHDAEAEWTVICMPLLGVATGIDLLDAAFSSKTLTRDGRLVGRVAAEARPLAPVPRALAEAGRFSQDLSYAEAIARLGLELAEGLEAAHAAGILHRDIKPSNVLLAWPGRAMLLDFNLSADVEVEVQGVAGTLAYMAPELVQSLIEGDREAARRFDPRWDVYSLGAVLYELLCGRLPMKPERAERLPGDAYEAWLASKLRGAEALAGAEWGVDSRLSQIVLKCLAYEAGERYSTAGELAAALRDYLARGGRLLRFAKRNRRAILLGAMGVIGGGALAGIYWSSRPSALAAAYRTGLAEYEEGRFAEAAEKFTRCSKLEPGWPHAIFGRAQALRRMEKWELARTDYLALEPHERAWAFALVGYCNMRLKHFDDAVTDFRRAHQAGLRDVGFLLNYANTEVERQSPIRAIPIYTEVIEREPANRAAIRNRGLAHAWAVMNDGGLPNKQAFEDADRNCAMDSEDFLADFCAAIVYGEAALKDAKYELVAIEHLTKALKKGMPIEMVKKSERQLKRLLAFVDAGAIVQAKHDANMVLPLRVPEDPPGTGDWNVFEQRFGVRSRLLAQARG